MKTDLTLPTVHLNGTSAEELLTQLEAAGHAAQTLLEKLSAASPNARDYYVQGPGAFERADDEHDERLRKVRSVLEELQAIALSVDEQRSR